MPLLIGLPRKHATSTLTQAKQTFYVAERTLEHKTLVKMEPKFKKIE
jgi:hypothetical protein